MSQLSLFPTKSEKTKLDNPELDYEEYSLNSPVHLNDVEASRKFIEEKSSNPNAYITIDNLDCGHWVIKSYKTELQKRKFLQNKWSELVGNFYSRLINEFK
jgi:hypothetical protein